MKMADVVKSLKEEGLTRETVEERAIYLLEDEGFDTLVEIIWQACLLQYGHALMEDSWIDFADEVTGSGR